MKGIKSVRKAVFLVFICGTFVFQPIWLYLCISEIKDVCELFGCSTDLMFKALTQRTVEAKGDKVRRDLEVADVS